MWCRGLGLGSWVSARDARRRNLDPVLSRFSYDLVQVALHQVHNYGLAFGRAVVLVHARLVVVHTPMHVLFVLDRLRARTGGARGWDRMADVEIGEKVLPEPIHRGRVHHEFLAPLIDPDEL